MKVRNILDNTLTKVGVLKELEDGDFAVEIEGKWLGIYENFDSWNKLNGNCYSLEEDIDFSDISLPFEELDIDLELDNVIKDDDYDNYIDWD